jgi:hypothetical protein
MSTSAFLRFDLRYKINVGSRLERDCDGGGDGSVAVACWCAGGVVMAMAVAAVVAGSYVPI